MTYRTIVALTGLLAAAALVAACGAAEPAATNTPQPTNTTMPEPTATSTPEPTAIPLPAAGTSRVDASGIEQVYVPAGTPDEIVQKLYRDALDEYKNAKSYGSDKAQARIDKVNAKLGG